MAAIPDAGLERAITRLMDIMSEDGRGPEETIALVSHVVAVWTQEHPTATPWQSYSVDNYQFSIRRNVDGELEILNEVIDDES